MNRRERDTILDSVPADDVDAALQAMMLTLEEHGELDGTLSQEMAELTGAPGAFWKRLVDARAAWRLARGLSSTPMPFPLGE